MGFQMFLKLLSVATEVTVGGRLIQIRAAAEPKARSPCEKSDPWHDELLTGRRAEMLYGVCVSGPLKVSYQILWSHVVPTTKH